MSTQIDKIPLAKKQDGRWLLPVTHCSVAWMACARILGIREVSKPTTCFEGQEYELTERGRELWHKNKDIKGFSKDDVLQERDSGAHDLCQWAIRSGQGSTLKVEPWLHTFNKLWKNQTDQYKKKKW